MVNIIIHLPWEFTPTSGGNMACHILNHNLSVVGYNSYITTNKLNSLYKGQSITELDAIKLSQQDNTIVIYPEIYSNNPLNCKKVIRWILNSPDVFGKNEHTYGENDIYLKYASFYKVQYEERVKGLLGATDPNPYPFKNYNLTRKGMCHLIRKGNEKSQNWHTSDSISIDNYFIGNINYSNLEQIFNKKEKFISYDDCSYISVIAALCGCLSIVVPKNGIKKEDFHVNHFKYGISYGLDDLDYAKSTINLIPKYLKELQEESIEQARKIPSYF